MRQGEVVPPAHHHARVRRRDLFEQDFYVDRDSVREAVRRRGMCNLIHTASVVKVDFVIRKDSVLPARAPSIGGHEFAIVAGRPRAPKLWARLSTRDLTKVDISRRFIIETNPESDAEWQTVPGIVCKERREKWSSDTISSLSFHPAIHCFVECRDKRKRLKVLTPDRKPARPCPWPGPWVCC